MLFNRTGQLPFLFQILFLGFGSSSLAQLPKGVDAFLSVLPFARGVTVLKAIAAGTGEAATFRWATVMPLAVNSAGYVIVGIAFFLWTERRAKQRGLLGRY